MHPGIKRYLDQVLAAASLARFDDSQVREELADHLSSILQAAPPSSEMAEPEVYQMIEREFGNAEKMGKGIARAKGRIKTFIKKHARRTLISAATVLMLAFAAKWQVVEAYSIPGNSMAPVISPNALVLVNKLAYKFSAPIQGDIVVFEDAEGRANVAQVERVDSANGAILVNKLNRPETSGYPKNINDRALIGPGANGTDHELSQSWSRDGTEKCC